VRTSDVAAGLLNCSGRRRSHLSADDDHKRKLPGCTSHPRLVTISMLQTRSNDLEGTQLATAPPQMSNAAHCHTASCSCRELHPLPQGNLVHEPPHVSSPLCLQSPCKSPTCTQQPPPLIRG
jgi:hypothetical protein